VRKLLIQLDTAPHPSVFDRVVAFDGGADEVLSYGGVTEELVREFVHGAIFTRGPKDLHHTAIFIGGTDMAAGERLLRAVEKTFFGPMRVSVMLDSNGSNTTAVAAVARLQQAVGDVKGLRTLVTAGSGPVGQRAAGLLARAGAEVTVTSRRAGKGAMAAAIESRFGDAVAAGSIREVAMAGAAQASSALEGMQLLLNAGPAGACLVPREAWAGRAGLRAAADLNAVAPLGIEGIEVSDSAVEREGAIVFGALGVGGLKMKIHKACIARLFERNDLVLDAETIAEVARSRV
jgi:hypothetical protein